MNITYQYICNLDKDREYHFTLYNIIGSICCVLSYNEDSNGMICLDIMNKGYTGQCYYYNTHSEYQQNKFYKLTNENLIGLINLSEYIKQDIIKNMTEK